MAFIIKSNSALKYPASAVGNIHDYYGAQDYRAMLDFKNEVYKVDGVEKSIDDVVSTTRTSKGSYIDKIGNTKEATSNRPRLSLLSEISEYGLYISDPVTNSLTSGLNGTTFSIPNAKENICVSWEGSGLVEIVSSNSTTFSSQIKALGRTHRFYSRSSAVTGTITIAGDARKIMVYSGSVASPFVNYGESQAGDTVTLTPALANLISSGSGTVLCRFAFNPDNGGSKTFSMAVTNSLAPNGGMLVQAGHRYTALATGEVLVYSDGSARNAGVQQARNIGNRAVVNVVGLTFSGFGQRTGIISHGQSGFGGASTSGATPPTALDTVTLGREVPGMVSTGYVLGGIITHIVVYDRILSEKEAGEAAFFGN